MVVLLTVAFEKVVILEEIDFNKIAKKYQKYKFFITNQIYKFKI